MKPNRIHWPTLSTAFEDFSGMSFDDVSDIISDDDSCIYLRWKTEDDVEHEIRAFNSIFRPCSWQLYITK